MESCIDFVIPLCKYNIIIKTVVEALIEFYKPRFIYVICPEIEIDNLLLKFKNYENIKFIAEEYFFVDFYKLTSKKIKTWYTYIDESSREFGWWYQQIIKLGALNQIKELSDPFIVWDSDLIPLKKWDIYPTNESPYYKFAILQEEHKNEFNKSEYDKSLYALLNIKPCNPEITGTFVPHHFVFHHKVIRSLLNKIINKHIECKSWIEAIMKLSKKYYRFSEYKVIATYMYYYFPELLHYHEFHKFGKDGLRYRVSTEIVKKIENAGLIEEDGVSFENFKKFALELEENSENKSKISYIQIEHL
jgi:hypothetical protein